MIPSKYLICLISVLILSSCNRGKVVHIPKSAGTIDSIIQVINHNTGFWYKSYSDSTESDGDSIMLYKDGDTALNAPFINNKLHGEAQLYDTAGKIIMSFTYYEGRLIGPVKTYYSDTRLIHYHFQLYDAKPVGEYLDFYNHFHDTVIYNGHITTQSTHLREYRFYDITGKQIFKRNFNSDLSISSDSGQTITPITNNRKHLLNTPTTVTIWCAQPYGSKSEITLLDNQTNKIKKLSLNQGEAQFIFTPENTGFYRFSVFHNLTDTANKTLRKDSLTFRLHIINE